MDKITATLLQLKDIHQPPPISWWPLAWGWYPLSLILFSFLFLIFFWWKWHRLSQRRFALKQWAEIMNRYETQGDITKSITALSHLLKISVLSKNSRLEVASLHDESWLFYLDQLSDTQAYTQGCGRVFSSLPYMPPTKVKDIDMAALFSLVKLTIKRCL